MNNLNDRHKYVGASEVASLFGHGFKTPYQLWQEKSGHTKPQDLSDNERVQWGLKLEDVILEAFFEEMRYSTPNLLDMKKSGEAIVHPIIKGLRATPDGYATYRKDKQSTYRELIEIKTVDKYVYSNGWHDEKPPLKYQLQLQAQMMCTGIDSGYIVALIGGNALKYWHYTKNEKTCAIIEKAVRDFWDSVDKRQPPKLTAKDEDMAKTLLDVGTNNDYVDVGSNNELNHYIEQLAENKAIADEALQKVKEARANIYTLAPANKLKTERFKITLVQTKEVLPSPITPDMVGEMQGGRRASTSIRIHNV